jgi:hypothetical protein
MENNVKIKRLPNRDYVKDHVYLEEYGRFDKSIVQSKTMESAMRFLMKGLSVAKKETRKKDTEEWINHCYLLIKYWNQCTELAKKRRDLSRKKEQRKGRQR